MLPAQLLVNEIFGPTVQGEGPSLGKQAVFLRLAMCNLKCVWCDTKFTWDWENYSKADEVHVMNFADVADELWIHQGEAHLLVISGGEPLLQGKNLVNFLDDWAYRYTDIEVETNGTIPPPPALSNYVTYNVSPKLRHSGNDSRRINNEVLRKFLKVRSRFKFVVQESSDLYEVDKIVWEASIPKESVWIMPEGTTPSLIQSRGAIADEVIGRGWNMTTRLHVLTWGNKRGI